MGSFQYVTYIDLYKMNNVNFDPLTEVFNDYFYLSYFYKWPHMNILSQGLDGHISGYIIGKEEGIGREYHGHVTALSIEEDSRRMGKAQELMIDFEQISEQIHKGFFIDLFVRTTNIPAITMYKQLGYVINEEILNYYNGGENALDMRKYTNINNS